MINIYTFKSFFSKVDEHLSFEFYCSKAGFKGSTQLLLKPRPNTLYGHLGGAQNGLNIVDLLNTIEVDSNIIIDNKESLILEASQYITQHLNPTSIISYAVFKTDKYYEAPKLTHSIIRELCDNKLIVNINELKMPIEEIDLGLLFKEAIQLQHATNHKILHVEKSLILQ